VSLTARKSILSRILIAYQVFVQGGGWQLQAADCAEFRCLPLADQIVTEKQFTCSPESPQENYKAKTDDSDGGSNKDENGRVHGVECMRSAVIPGDSVSSVRLDSHGRLNLQHDAYCLRTFL
jgi:hypothetical protein